jgi:hypothetical protein
MRVKWEWAKNIQAYDLADAEDYDAARKCVWEKMVFINIEYRKRRKQLLDKMISTIESQVSSFNTQWKQWKSDTKKYRPALACMDKEIERYPYGMIDYKRNPRPMLCRLSAGKLSTVLVLSLAGGRRSGSHSGRPTDFATASRIREFPGSDLNQWRKRAHYPDGRPSQPVFGGYAHRRCRQGGMRRDQRGAAAHCVAAGGPFTSSGRYSKCIVS